MLWTPWTKASDGFSASDEVTAAGRRRSLYFSAYDPGKVPSFRLFTTRSRIPLWVLSLDRAKPPISLKYDMIGHASNGWVNVWTFENEAWLQLPGQQRVHCKAR